MRSEHDLAEHILKVVPKSAKVVFENDKIRVIEIVMRKGQKLTMHSHMPSLAYGITSSKFKATSPDGKSRVVRMKKGEASWSDERSHSVENLGGLSRALSIELKG